MPLRGLPNTLSQIKKVDCITKIFEEPRSLSILRISARKNTALATERVEFKKFALYFRGDVSAMAEYNLRRRTQKSVADIKGTPSVSRNISCFLIINDKGTEFHSF